MSPQQISILFRLEERWDFFRRLKGDKWAGIVAEYEKYLREQMDADKCDLISAALAIGKRLSSAGHDPNELFAAAVELIKREDAAAKAP